MRSRSLCLWRLSHPGEFIWKLSHGNWTSFLEREHFAADPNSFVSPYSLHHTDEAVWMSSETLSLKKRSPVAMTQLPGNLNSHLKYRKRLKMDEYHLSDECSLHSEMQLHEFSGNQALDCSDAFSHDLCPSTRDVIYSGLSNVDVDPSLSTTNMNNDSLEDNLDNLSFYSVKDCDSAKLLGDCDTGSQPLLPELSLPAPSAPKEVEQGGRTSSGSGKKGKHHQSCPQVPFLDCSLCGKVFSSTSSLSKHYVTHSQERKHVCNICSKAFKRQDHLSGHMLTHQKTKPFICIEQGCNKSYSDHRSLRRHYEMHHGLRVLKEEEACEGSASPQGPRAQMGSGGRRATERLAVHPDARAPNTTLPPNRDLLRCLVSTLVGQKLPSALSPCVGPNESDSSGSLQPCTSAYGQMPCIPPRTAAFTEVKGSTATKEPYPCQKNTASSGVYTVINSGNLSIFGPGENVAGLPERQTHPLPPFPLGKKAFEFWPNSTAPHVSFFCGQRLPATSQQSDGRFQWVRNVAPSGTQSKGNSGLYVAQVSRASAEDASQSSLGPSPAFESSAHNSERSEVLSFAPAAVATQGEALGEPKVSVLAARLPDNAERGVPQKGEAGPLFRQLFLTSQESSVNQDQMQVHSHLFQRITKSQHIVSHTQLLGPSQLAAVEADQLLTKPLQGAFPPQQTDLVCPVREAAENEGGLKQPCLPFRTDFSSCTEQEGQRPATPLQPLPSLPSPPSMSTNGSITRAKPSRTVNVGCLELQDFSSPGQCSVYENAPGNHTYGKAKQSGSGSPETRKKPKSKTAAKESGGKGPSRSGRARRKEKPKFDVSSVASPSQVAMASFSLPQASFDSEARTKPKLSIFNRIQGGNIYSFTSSAREEMFPPACSKTGGDPGDGNECGNSLVCAACSQLFYMERGLRSPVCFCSEKWQAAAGKEKQQACEGGKWRPQKLPLQAAGEGDTPEGKTSSEDGAVTPLVIPVSVPVTATHPQQQDSQVDEKASQDDKDLQEGLPPKKKRRRTCPKSLFIPPPAPPACSERPPGTGGCFQSNLRSPVFLMDHLLQGLVQCSSYTPPPMLSPIREGSGLYFNTLCSTSMRPAPSKMYTSVLDGTDGALLLSLVKDTTKFSVEPHINIGSRFQAVIPELQDRSSLENYEHPASLVWKPWGDITTNKETQKKVSDLLKLACSSAMPGGGTNVELAVHCLHEAQGNILEALQMLLLRGPQKPPGHPLANYHYSGSHLWTSAEKQLFKKAFSFHKKDFHLIQKKIQTKTVSQCVEYYYNWKKILKFDSRGHAVEKRSKREQDEIDMDDEKMACSPKKRPCPLPKQENNVKSRNYKKAAQSTFSSASSPKDSLDRPRGTGSQGVFPCKECTRVFDKIKSRNAHMKRHRLQEQMEPVIKIKWPMKHLKNQPKKDERNSDVGFLQW